MKYLYYLMARSQFKGRQFTLYLPTSKYLEIWRSRAKAAHCSLNHYILETVESAGEQQPAPKSDTDELNKLRAENQQLKAELDRLRIWQSNIFKIDEAKDTFQPVQFKEAVIRKMRTGGYWNSARIDREFKIYIQTGYNVGKILDELLDLGLIKETARGWQWIK